jgi:hypothetical protein
VLLQGFFASFTSVRVLTQKVHLASNTQQAEKLASHAQRVEMTCQSIFPEN